LHAIDKKGQTALHLATQSKHLKIVQYLVENQGTNVEGMDVDGYTALHIAGVAGYVALVVYLVGHFPAL
jgi:ankyrin repeat protein